MAALALSRGWPVSVDAIVQLLWDDTAPPGVTATLQAYVSQLRRVIEPERQRRAPATVLVTVAPGYALRVPDDTRDAHRFEQAVTAAHRRWQPLAGGGRSPLGAAVLAETVEELDAGLALWRGTPYAELADAYARTAAYAGHCCSAGSGLAVGPVDAFLAMAAAATGERDLAARHAEDALVLAEAWEIPLVAAWVREQRAVYDY
ncbi:putative transcriptional regulator [Nocardioides sp. JS614]|nr:putative transcriptional regulator [Nocardioides sp. JS614]